MYVKIKFLLSFFLFISLITTQLLGAASSLTMEEINKLTASDGASGDYFGNSVAISGDTVVVGAQGGEFAMIFERNPTTGLFDQRAKLTASDADSDDYFGSSVAISGDTVVVGARGDDHDTAYPYIKDIGSAYVFVKPTNGWTNKTQDAKLKASDPEAYDNFGNYVSISGNTIAIAAYAEDSSVFSGGSVYVFQQNESLGRWINSTETAKLTASDATEGDYFGISVAISGDTIAVGAHYGPNYSGRGMAYIFEKPYMGWADNTENAKLTASDAANDDSFGWSVAISGDSVVVGAYWDDDGGSNSGSAYIFDKPDPDGWANATEDAKLTASDATEGDFFGNSVAISGDTVVVGAERNDDGGSTSGSAYLFERPTSGVWVSTTEDSKITASDAAENSRFGSSVAIDEDTAVIGAISDNYTGAAYIFKEKESQDTFPAIIMYLLN